jgi:fructokinase
MALAIGIDLGGTKVEIVVIDEGGAELIRRRRPTPRDDYDGTLGAIAGLVDEAERELGRRATVGVSHPGAVSPATGLMKNANSTWLNGRAFDRDLSAKLARPVAFANDANCLALSEATDGAGAGAGVVFAVILGTGVGGGVVVNGRVLTGPNAIAGEWGHIPLPWPRDDERPGPGLLLRLKGCVETGWPAPASPPTTPGPRRARPGSGAGEAAEAGTRQRTPPLERYEDRLARAWPRSSTVLDPGRHRAGRRCLQRPDASTANVPRLWGRYVLLRHGGHELSPPLHGDSTGVRGRAWLGRPRWRRRQ